MYMEIYLHVCIFNTIMPRRGQKRALHTGTRVTDSFKVPYRYWESHMGPLKISQCS